MILTKTNNIGVFLEIVREIEPKRVLDIGMFLKRMGWISKRIMDLEYMDYVILDGIDFFPEIDFPVWKNVYDHIWSETEFKQNYLGEKYDLAVIYGLEEITKKTELSVFMEEIKGVICYLLTDQLLEEWKSGEYGIKSIRLDGNDTFYLINFGE